MADAVLGLVSAALLICAGELAARLIARTGRR